MFDYLRKLKRYLTDTFSYIQTIFHNVYITSKDILTVQLLTEEKDLDLGPGDTIELLPEYCYTEEALRELDHRDAEQGA